MPASARTTEPAAWPDGVIARYLTAAGATIDLSRPHDDSGALHGPCNGCGSYFGANTDSIVRPRAQAHAETCRALPRPAASASVDLSTLTSEQRRALRRAADALGVVEACKERGERPLITDEITAYRYRVAARAHGIGEEQVRAYLKTLPRPTA